MYENHIVVLVTTPEKKISMDVSLYRTHMNENIKK